MSHFIYLPANNFKLKTDTMKKKVVKKLKIALQNILKK